MSSNQRTFTELLLVRPEMCAFPPFILLQSGFMSLLKVFSGLQPYWCGCLGFLEEHCLLFCSTVGWYCRRFCSGMKCDVVSSENMLILMAFAIGSSQLHFNWALSSLPKHHIRFCSLQVVCGALQFFLQYSTSSSHVKSCTGLHPFMVPDLLT